MGKHFSSFDTHTAIDLTLDKYELIQLTNVFFCTLSCSSETKSERVINGPSKNRWKECFHLQSRKVTPCITVKFIKLNKNVRRDKFLSGAPLRCVCFCLLRHDFTSLMELKMQSKQTLTFLLIESFLMFFLIMPFIFF